MNTQIWIFRFTVLAILLVVFVLIDGFTWRGISTLMKKRTKKFKTTVKYFYFGLSVAVAACIIGFMFIPSLQHSRTIRNVLIGFAFEVFAAKMVFFVFVLINDAVYYFRRAGAFAKSKITKPATAAPVVDRIEKADDSNAEKIKRSEFLYRAGLVAGMAPVYFFTKGILKDAHNYKLHHLDLSFPNLPQAFDGLKIVQISDVHSGSFTDKDAVYKGIKMIMDEKPDVFFFTGDMVNTYAEEMNDYMEVFAPIQAPMGRFSILGNHDYGDYGQFSSPEAKAQNLLDLEAHHKDLGWHLMKNENITLDRGGQRIGLIGVENWGHSKRFPKYGDLDKATQGLPEVPFKILLSHDPSHWDAKVRPEHPDIDLMLAGHTHGMQFGIENKFIKFSPVQWMYKQWAGLYQQGSQYLNVNRGYGYIGFPGRVGILPEITVITLKRGAAPALVS